MEKNRANFNIWKTQDCLLSAGIRIEPTPTDGKGKKEDKDIDNIDRSYKIGLYTRWLRDRLSLMETLSFKFRTRPESGES